MSDDPILALYEEASSHQSDAYLFLVAWHSYCHMIDDLVDGDTAQTPESLLEALVMANKVYSLPFYAVNAHRLSGVVVLVSSTYADSVAWEKLPGWQAHVADVIRQCGNDMILAVADITGGWRLVRSISLRLREAAWHNQHKEVPNA